VRGQKMFRVRSEREVTMMTMLVTGDGVFGLVDEVGHDERLKV
jgi:hypothetical protein